MNSPPSYEAVAHMLESVAAVTPVVEPLALTVAAFAP